MFAFSWIFIFILATIFCEYLVQCESTLSKNVVKREVSDSNVQPEIFHLKRPSKSKTTYVEVAPPQYPQAPYPQYASYPAYSYPPQAQFQGQPQYLVQQPQLQYAPPPAQYAHPPPAQYAHPPPAQYAHPPPAQYAHPHPAQYAPPPQYAVQPQYGGQQYRPPAYPYAYPQPAPPPPPPPPPPPQDYAPPPPASPAQVAESKNHPLAAVIKGSVTTKIRQVNTYAPTFGNVGAGAGAQNDAPDLDLYDEDNPMKDPELIQEFLIGRVGVMKNTMAIFMGGDGEADPSQNEVDESLLESENVSVSTPLKGREIVSNPLLGREIVSGPLMGREIVWDTKPKLDKFEDPASTYVAIPSQAKKNRYVDANSPEQKFFSWLNNFIDKLSSKQSREHHKNYRNYPKHGHHQRRLTHRKPHKTFALPSKHKHHKIKSISRSSNSSPSSSSSESQ